MVCESGVGDAQDEAVISCEELMAPGLIKLWGEQLPSLLVAVGCQAFGTEILENNWVLTVGRPREAFPSVLTSANYFLW